MYAALHAGWPAEEPGLLHHAGRLRRHGALQASGPTKRYFDVDRIVDYARQRPARSCSTPRSSCCGRPQAVGKGSGSGTTSGTTSSSKSYRLFDRWAADQIPFPGECFRQMTKELHAGEQADARTSSSSAARASTSPTIKVPFMHVVAEHDHIVPYEAARALVPMAGSDDKNEVMLKGGHVSLVAGGNAVHRLWPKLESWLSERSRMTLERAPDYPALRARRRRRRDAVLHELPRRRGGDARVRHAASRSTTCSSCAATSRSSTWSSDWLRRDRSAATLVTILATRGGADHRLRRPSIATRCRGRRTSPSCA